MRICTNCNASNPDDSVFCSVCGTGFAAQQAQPFPPQAYPPAQDSAAPNQGYTSSPGYVSPPQQPQQFAQQPYSPPPAPVYGGNVPAKPFKPGDPSKNWMGILAMILGILSILICCLWYLSLIFGLGGLIFGIIGRKSQQKGMATAGMVTGIIGLFISLIVIIFIVFAVAALPNWLDDIYDQYNSLLRVFSFSPRL